MLTGRHVIEPGSLTIQEIDEICGLAEQMIVDPAAFSDVCRGKILATLFFEPSTRTRLSFEAAMQRLEVQLSDFLMLLQLLLQKVNLWQTQFVLFLPMQILLQCEVQKKVLHT